MSHNDDDININKIIKFLFLPLNVVLSLCLNLHGFAPSILVFCFLTKMLSTNNQIYFRLFDKSLP